jgi:hypothetical protein
VSTTVTIFGVGAAQRIGLGMEVRVKLYHMVVSGGKGAHSTPLSFSLIGIVGGGVQLGPLSTAATNRPIVPAPGDYDDREIGGMIGRGNGSTQRKPAPVLFCPPQTPRAAQM